MTERAGDGVPLEAVDDLATTDGDEPADGLVVRQAWATPSGPITLRTAQLEAWRLDVDRWRLQLTGVDGANGRVGRLLDTVAELRGDVGDRKECARVRASADLVDLGRRRAIATLIAAGLALGGAGWAMIRSRDKDVAAETIRRMELELRVRNLEQRLDRRSP